VAEKALISIVIPCLNEEKTIGDVIRQAQEGFTRAGYPYEIVVADNGSIDASRTISESAGARVVDVQKKGYGIALRTGIEAAHGTVVLFGDADLTYDFREGPTLVDELFKGSAGLVIGSRLRGTIEDGAMPLWHRYVGTPILTALIALLFGTTLSDSNSGFRAFRVQDFKNWRIHSDGMEICSEVIINCLRSGQTISEIPITLRASLKDRVPHLSTWRDGMRNLLIILSRAPQAFTYPGLLCVAASALVAIPSAMFGHITIGAFSLFEHHSMILAIMVGFIGSQSLIYGLLLDAPAKNRWPSIGISCGLTK